MGMNDVETEFTRDLHDAVGNREKVLRFAEQRIGRRDHLMERQSLLKLPEPEWRFRADEMYLMTAKGKRLSQLGGDDAAATNRGIADDADVQRAFHSGRRCGLTT